MKTAQLTWAALLLAMVACIFAYDAGKGLERLNDQLKDYQDSVQIFRAETKTLAHRTEARRWQLDNAGKFEFCGATYDLSNQQFRERLQDEVWRLYDRPGWLMMMSQRLGRYQGLIEHELAQHQLPLELKYMFVWESELNPVARSWTGALGLPQFILTSGRESGLVINHRFDERKNPVKSISAACVYLNRYYPVFNDWLLTLAAYNYGPSGVKQLLQIQQVDNYLQLSASTETERYVFQVMAVAYVFKQGLLGDITWLRSHPPLPECEEQRLTIKQTIPIVKLSQQLRVEWPKFILLNPHLPNILRPGTYPINIPLI